MDHLHTNPVITNHLGEAKYAHKLKIRYKRKYDSSGFVMMGLLCVQIFSHIK